MRSKILLSFLLLAILFSCKKDDGDTNDLIGTWKTNMDVNHEYFTFIFNSDGAGTWLINVNKDPLMYFTYSFDSKTNKLTIASDGETGYFYVKFITKSSMQFFSDASFKEKETEIMYKQ